MSKDPKPSAPVQTTLVYNPSRKTHNASLGLNEEYPVSAEAAK